MGESLNFLSSKQIVFSVKEAGLLNQGLESVSNPRNSQGKSLKIEIRQEYSCQIKYTILSQIWISDKQQFFKCKHFPYNNWNILIKYFCNVSHVNLDIIMVKHYSLIIENSNLTGYPLFTLFYETWLPWAGDTDTMGDCGMSSSCYTFRIEGWSLKQTLEKTILLSQEKARKTAFVKLELQYNLYFQVTIHTRSRCAKCYSIQPIDFYASFFPLHLLFICVRFPKRPASCYLNSTFPSRSHLPFCSWDGINI